jgi:hypothetical protein
MDKCVRQKPAVELHIIKRYPTLSLASKFLAAIEGNPP